MKTKDDQMSTTGKGFLARFVDPVRRAAAVLVVAFISQANADTVAFTSSGNWTVPAGVTSITVEAWGGGGAGGGATGKPAKGGGGAGGQYAKRAVTVVPGNTYAVMVGSGGIGATGNGGSGGDSTFAGTTVVAKGGAGGTGVATGGAGSGSSAGGVGDVVFPGGSGSAGAVSGGSCLDGGAGGGGAGNSGAGGGASGNAGGTGTAMGGGTGGTGRNNSGAGNAGSNFGGGGGGACAESNADQNGGAGGNGRVVISFCPPPGNTPAGLSLTCVCDNFDRQALNPSPIFNSDWIVSRSDSTGILPRIATPGYMRLTDNTGNNAKAATVPGIFPASGNYISVEFRHFAYYGTGADGIAVTLSDYSVPPVPGAYGGSLGYAQKTGINGFAGGWIGVALDEYGNYQNPTEGRLGGPGFIAQSVGVRGSGTGTAGYRWLGGTGALSPEVDNNGSTSPSRGHMYQVIVDARNEPTTTSVAVNRDTGSGYAPLISIPNVYSAASGQGFTQAPVPANWQISFTGSTGGSTNIHEISNLRICAQTIVPPSGGVANGFNAIDSDYGNPPSVAVQNYLNGHIYMKLVGEPFRLNVAALDDNQIQTAYVVSGTKTVTVKFVDNTDGACVLDSTKPNYCSTICKAKTAVPGGYQELKFETANAGQKQSADFKLNTAYKNLVAIISDSVTTACSTDAFSVRPKGIASVTSSNATNATTGGTPIFKAGSDPFSLTLTTTGVADIESGYTGVAKIDNTQVIPESPAVVRGQLAPAIFAAAISGTGSSLATGTIFTYSEVGGFKLRGVDPAKDTTSARSVYDGVRTATECAGLAAVQCDALKLSGSWTGIDSLSTAQDCVADSYSNTLIGGKYGCSFGLVADTVVFGRFVPYEFLIGTPVLINRQASACSPASAFSYLDEGIGVQFTLQARAGGGNVTRNYAGSLAKLGLSPDGSGMKFATAVPAPTFSAIDSARIFGSGFAPTVWPIPADANDTSSGQITVTGTVTVSSLNTVANNRVTPDGPFTGAVLGIAPQDLDGVRILTYDMDSDGVGGADHKQLGTTNLYFGELRLLPAISSELLPLTMTAEVLRWNGTGFVPNGDDGCTKIPAADLRLFNWTKNLAAGETSLTTSPLAFSAGKGTIGLSKPGAGNDGSVTVKACLVTDSETGMACPTAAGLPYLAGRWRGSSKYDANPATVASFGLYKGAGRIIHFQENF